MPEGALKYLENDKQRWVATTELFQSTRVVLFSCPGAFTTKSTNLQLPSDLRLADEFHRRGVDSIICISVNDPWVMKAWGELCAVGDRIRMLADAHCEYHTALGLQMDCTRMTLGWRSQRFSMLIEDGVVNQLNIEVPGGYELSDASVVLNQLKSMPFSPERG